MGESDLDPVEEARLLGVSLEAYLQVFSAYKNLRDGLSLGNPHFIGHLSDIYYSFTKSGPLNQSASF